MSQAFLPRGELSSRVRSLSSAATLSNSNDRIIRYKFSENSVDRYNDVILSGAWQLTKFLQNPVFLWAHDTKQPPIGRVADIGEFGGILSGSVEYMTRDQYPLADTVFEMVKNGFLNAVSVGFVPLKWKPSNDRTRQGGMDFEQVDLLEISQVPVPALATALVTARSAGIDTSPFTSWAERALDDKGTSTMSRDQLAAVRRAAGSAKVYPSAVTPSSTSMALFPTLSHQLRAIALAADKSRIPDHRLIRAPSGMNEGDPANGGFLVQTNFIPDLIASLYEEAEIAPLCDRRETSKPLADVKVPGIDETSRANGSRWGGVAGYWAAEADQVPASKPKFKNLEFSAKKIVIVVYGTDELMNDAPMFETHIKRAFAAEASFMTDLAIVAGNGSGQPLGIVNAPGTITINKETGQASATITAANVRAMWSRLPAPSRKRAVWLVNEDAEEQLEQMNNVVGTSGSPTPSAQALYMSAGSGGSKCPLLKGRPVIAVEQCPQIGTKGDIILADLSQYILIDGGTMPAISVHVRFVEDEIVWRFVVRIDGQPGYSSPITPYNGGATRSPFVVLESR